MVSSGLLRRRALVRTDVSEEPGASFIRVTKIGELGTTQAATSNRRRLLFCCTLHSKWFRNVPAVYNSISLTTDYALVTYSDCKYRKITKRKLATYAEIKQELQLN
jgi:hypothetical protein